MSKTLMLRQDFPTASPPAGPAKILVGSWQLIKAEYSAEQKKHRGEKPHGMIVYDKNGYMSVQLTPGKDYECPEQYPLTPEEFYDVFLGFFSYYGTYTVDWENKLVLHHRIFMAPPTSTDAPFVRRFEIIDDQNKMLKPLESENILFWQR
jgi:hypothetical protein